MIKMYDTRCFIGVESIKNKCWVYTDDIKSLFVPIVRNDITNKIYGKRRIDISIYDKIIISKILGLPYFEIYV